MPDFQSLVHGKGDCKSSIGFIPKDRRKVLDGKLRHAVGRILRDLFEQTGIGLLEGQAATDHICLFLSLTPKYRLGVHGGVSEGQECLADPLGTAAGVADYRAALLGDRKLVRTVGQDEEALRTFIRERER
jgi:putative transposase